MRHSYTKISMYMECPASKRYRYDERRATPPSAAATRGTEYHRKLEESLGGAPVGDEFSYYASYIQQLRDHGAHAEYKFALTREWEPVPWEDERSWVIGVADVWVPKIPTSHVQDWKTGKIYDSHERQGEFYSTALFSYVPDAHEVKATFIYTDLRKERNWTYHRDQLESLRARWGARIERMERDTECAPTPSFKCRSCPFMKFKGGPCKVLGRSYMRLLNLGGWE